MLNDPLANALSVILNAESRNRKSCTISPASKLIKKVLEMMKEHNYLGNVTETETSFGKILKVELLGMINKCGAVKPNYTVQNRNFEKFEKKFLPAKDFGFIVVSTSQGVMTHIDAKQKSLGGKLIAYFY